MIYYEIRDHRQKIKEVSGLNEFEVLVSERNDIAVEVDSCRHLVFCSYHQI